MLVSPRAADRLELALKIVSGLLGISIGVLISALLYLAIQGAAVGAHESSQRLPMAPNTCRNGSPLAVWVVNALTASDCSTGGGALEHWCACIDGVWAAVPASSLVNIAADGHITLSGTATYWEDMQVPGFAVRVGGTAPTFASWATHTPLYAYFFQATNDEEVHGSIQMPHRWAGTPIEFHVHWFPEATADGAPANQKVRWCIDYTWAEYGVAFPATTTAQCSVTHGPADANVVVDRMYITEVATINPGTGADQASSVLYFRLYRDANDAADNYEGRAGLLSVDAHFESNKLGSNTQSPD